MVTFVPTAEQKDYKPYAIPWIKGNGELISDHS